MILKAVIPVDKLIHFRNGKVPSCNHKENYKIAEVKVYPSQMIFFLKVSPLEFFNWIKVSLLEIFWYCLIIIPVIKPSNLLIQSQQWKHQNNVWNIFKASNEDARTTDDVNDGVLVSISWILNRFYTCRGVSIVDF